jgi:hypothetical protein
MRSSVIVMQKAKGLYVAVASRLRRSCRRRRRAAARSRPLPRSTHTLGRYEFVPGVMAQIRRHGEELEIEVTGRESLYLPARKAVALAPVTANEFELGTPRADRLRIDRDTRGKVVGFTINPGPWPIGGRRLPPG